MTVKEFAKQKGVSNGVVYRMIRTGEIKARKVGRRWDIQIESRESSGTVLHDAEKHILLRDQAHKRRIHTESEFAEYLSRVGAAEYDIGNPDKRMEVFDVQIPDFPPVPRSPLALIFSIGGSGDGGPFAEKPWTGRQPAVKRDFWTNRETFAIAKAMVPNVDMPDRIAYMWQVPLFRPKRYIPARRWCRLYTVNVVDFYTSDLVDKLVRTVNPYVLEEKAVGSYSPTCRCILRKDLKVFEEQFLGGRKSVLPNVPTWPGWDYDAVPAPPDPPLGPEQREQDQEQGDVDVVDEREILASEQPKPVVVPDDRYIAEGATFYNPSVVLRALRKTIGKQFRLFGGQVSDAKIVGIKRESLEEFLRRDDTNKRSYILDIGGRNFDCDDFAIMIRAALSRHGMNSAGIIWGDGHAWNFFVVVGSKGPEIVFVEPQTDALVSSLTGEYSIKRRCEVYL